MSNSNTELSTMISLILIQNNMTQWLILVLGYYPPRSHCATSRRVLGSIPGCFVGEFSKAPMKPCALGSTQPLKMSTSNFLGVKAAGAQGWRNLPPSTCRVSRRSRSLNFLEPQEPSQACSGIPLPLPFTRRAVFTGRRFGTPCWFPEYGNTVFWNVGQKTLHAG
jgi:hypothetical protein